MCVCVIELKILAVVRHNFKAALFITTKSMLLCIVIPLSLLASTLVTNTLYYCTELKLKKVGKLGSHR